ncbi:MAG: ABC transporter permease subunit, partial [Phycisphaerales bacterium]|nr:ABC transporter permease subunit [Phycisphaerales bacterium]
MRRSKTIPWLLMISLLVGFGIFLAWPIWLVVATGFEGMDGGFTLYHIIEVFRDPVTLRGLFNALSIAVCTTILCLLIGIPLAICSVRYEFRGKGFLNALVLVPLILPPFVGAIGLQHLLGKSGAINAWLIDMGFITEGVDFIGNGGFWAIVFIEALHLYPILYLNAVAALANLDPALDEAAENLGATSWQRLRQIILPLIRPGLFAGSTIVFIWSFTELGTPLMFDYQEVTPVQIFNGLKEIADSRQPYALTAVLLLVAVGIYVLGKFAFGGKAYTMYAKASIQSTAKRLGGFGSTLVFGFFAFVIFLAILPHISVVLTSLSVEGSWYRSIFPQEFTMGHYSQALGHDLAIGSIRNSLFYSVLAVAVDIVLGICIGYLIVRTTIPGRGLLDALSMLP